MAAYLLEEADDAITVSFLSIVLILDVILTIQDDLIEVIENFASL